MTVLSQGRETSSVTPWRLYGQCTEVIQTEPGVYGDGMGQKLDAHSDAHCGVHL